jgi:hypothetical protein
METMFEEIPRYIILFLKEGFCDLLLTLLIRRLLIIIRNITLYICMKKKEVVRAKCHNFLYDVKKKNFLNFTLLATSKVSIISIVRSKQRFKLNLFHLWLELSISSNWIYFYSWDTMYIIVSLLCFFLCKLNTDPRFHFKFLK